MSDSNTNKHTKMEILTLLRELRLLENSYGGTYYWACLNGFNGNYYKNLARFINPTLYDNYTKKDYPELNDNHYLQRESPTTTITTNTTNTTATNTTTTPSTTFNETFDAHFIDLVRTIGCNV